MKLPKLLPALFLALLTSALPAREWTSADGRKLEADYVSATVDMVTLKRAADGRTFTLAIRSLSTDDQVFIRNQTIKPATAPAAPAAAPKAIEGEYASLVTGDWALSQKGNLPFAFYGAKDLDASKTYPIILALHGRGQNNENGKQVGGWMKSFTKPERYEKNPCFILAPLGYQPFGGQGTAWNSAPGAEAIELLKDMIKKLPIDKTRVYAAGHSMGGFGTVHLMSQEKRLFAAGVPVAGCGGSSEAGILKRTPLWLFHAVDDDVVQISGSRSFAEAMGKSKTFKFTEYPDGGHGIAGKVFEDPEVHTWLFSQVNK